MTTVEARPLTERCARIFAGREHALFGISALNGYFSLKAIAGLLGWAIGQFARVDVLVPGIELEGTLAARGVLPGKAGKQARAAINNTRNRVTNTLAALDAPQVGVFSWTDLGSRPAYQALRGEMERLYAEDDGFRQRCVAALEPALGTREPTTGQVRDAMPFLLSELPLMVDSPAIFGANSSVFCYPKMMPVAEWLYCGMLPIRPSRDQGMLTTRLTGVLAGEDH
ncbi:tRNA-dependent cyclodipeptide synthase [Nonomuraea sp. NBC_01738]|uniref:tRNA-dependent cyclodipeptide synthase n=1 Tax=Nonomuraea sp. NBC_01738 TaxID=2976003 RepID=UPI002E164EEB|nr:tRNA-dependent cyclodipeptide synthase [Nonomuraea sp. NBC_01738]